MNAPFRKLVTSPPAYGTDEYWDWLDDAADEGPVDFAAEEAEAERKDKLRWRGGRDA